MGFLKNTILWFYKRNTLDELCSLKRNKNHNCTSEKSMYFLKIDIFKYRFAKSYCQNQRKLKNYLAQDPLLHSNKYINQRNTWRNDFLGGRKAWKSIR